MRIASTQQGSLKNAFKADLIYSNYEDNVFVVDGVSINKSSVINKSTYSEIDRMINRQFKCIL